MSDSLPDQGIPGAPSGSELLNLSSFSMSAASDNSSPAGGRSNLAPSAEDYPQPHPYGWDGRLCKNTPQMNYMPNYDPLACLSREFGSSCSLEAGATCVHVPL